MIKQEYVRIQCKNVTYYVKVYHLMPDVPKLKFEDMISMWASRAHDLTAKAFVKYVRLKTPGTLCMTEKEFFENAKNSLNMNWFWKNTKAPMFVISHQDYVNLKDKNKREFTPIRKGEKPEATQTVHETKEGEMKFSPLGPWENGDDDLSNQKE